MVWSRGGQLWVGECNGVDWVALPLTVERQSCWDSNRSPVAIACNRRRGAVGMELEDRWVKHIQHIGNVDGERVCVYKQGRRVGGQWWPGWFNLNTEKEAAKWKQITQNAITSRMKNDDSYVDGVSNEGRRSENKTRKRGQLDKLKLIFLTRLRFTQNDYDSNQSGQRHHKKSMQKVCMHGLTANLSLDESGHSASAFPMQSIAFDFDPAK